MAEDRKRGLSDDQWAEVRIAFEAGESIAALSKRFGVKRDTIAARRDRAAWTTGIGQVPGREEQRVMRDAVKSNVVDFKTRQVVEELEASGVMKQVVEQMVTGVQLHSKLELGLLQFAADTLDRADSNKLRPGAITSEAAERKDVAMSIKIAVELSRLIGGKTAGMPSVNESLGAEAGLTIRRQRIEPQKILVNEKGRIA